MTHPTPSALVGMTADELASYREQVREVAIETNDLTGAYMTRVALVDAILADRKAANAVAWVDEAKQTNRTQIGFA